MTVDEPVEPEQFPRSRRSFWTDRPWWIPPFLGSVPEIAPRSLRLLGLISLALFFESYDLSMLTSALKYIAADLGMADTELATYMSVIRLGALPALLVVPIADRFGRRRVFLACVVGFSVATCATAFSQTAEQFVAVQMVFRTFMLAASAIGVVMVTEEFPSQHRGWGLGILGALAAMGHGLGAGLFAAIDSLPYGWRALYVVGLAPLALLPIMRRGIPETVQYTRHHSDRLARGDTASGLAGWIKPLSSLASAYPARTLVLSLAAGLVAAGEISVFQFTGYHTQTVHGWSPGQYSSMVLIAGAFGIVGNVVAGRLGDRLGRRIVGLAFLGTYPAAAWLFYQGTGFAIPLGFTLIVFCGTAGTVILRAFSTELFPTSYRGTSAGWLTFVQTLGWTTGLWVVGLGTNEPGDIARTTSLLAFLVLLGGVALLFLPETRRRELEDISKPHAT